MDRGTRRAVLMLCLILAGAARGWADFPACPDRVFVATFSGGTLFPWSNQTCAEVEPNDGTANAAAICSIESGAISVAGDHDYYRLPTLPLGSFTIETNSGTVGQCTGIDTLIEIRNLTATFLASDDDSGVNSCSRITWTPLDWGAPFYVDVSLVSGTTPLYGLTVTTNVPNTDDVEPNDGTGTAIPYCSMARGSVNPNLDADFYSFAATSGSTIQAKTNDGTVDSCLVSDTVVQIVDPAGVARAAVIHACQVVSFVADSTGTWYVAVWDFGQDEVIPLYGLVVTVTP